VGTDDGPAGDIRRCDQWLKRHELPADKTYRGKFHDNGNATLAAAHIFTCADLEVYTLVEVPYNWQWLNAASSLIEGEGAIAGMLAKLADDSLMCRCGR